jgi:hypothetical protein
MDTESQNKPPINVIESKPRRGWLIVRVFIGIVLLLASGLKATTPSLGDGLLHNWWFNVFVVEFELFFGIWLIFGLLPKLTWFTTIGLFSIFLAVSFYKTISGASTCGCWGNVEISPVYTVLLDVLVIGLLITFRPYNQWFYSFNNVKYWSDMKYQVVNYLLIIIPLGSFIFWQATQVNINSLQKIGQVLEQGSVVRLEPKTWIDQEFPLRDYCDIGGKIVTGHWIVLLRRTGCVECQKAKPFIVKLVKAKNCPLAVLEMNVKGNNPDFEELDFITGFLNQEMSWFAETPIVMELENGIVKQVLLRDDLKQMRLEYSQQ